MKKEQEKSAPPRAARPGGMPGFPGSMPAGMRGFPGGMPGGKGNFPGGTPAGMGSGSGGTPGAPGGIDMSKILSVRINRSPLIFFFASMRLLNEGYGIHQSQLARLKATLVTRS